MSPQVAPPLWSNLSRSKTNQNRPKNLQKDSLLIPKGANYWVFHFLSHPHSQKHYILLYIIFVVFLQEKQLLPTATFLTPSHRSRNAPSADLCLEAAGRWTQSRVHLVERHWWGEVLCSVCCVFFHWFVFHWCLCFWWFIDVYGCSLIFMVSFIDGCGFFHWGVLLIFHWCLWLCSLIFRNGLWRESGAKQREKVGFG